jgi:hypothetical protein
MTVRIWLPSLLLAALPLSLTAQDPAPNRPQAEAGGVADVALQGYYLGGNSQPLTALSGVNAAFREYLPSLGFVTGNLEGYDDSTRGRLGQNSITFHGLLWKGRRWTITGGDFRFRTALVPLPFTNYSYPEIGARGARAEMTDGHRKFTLFWGEETLQTGPRITFRTSVPQSILGAAVQQSFGTRLNVAVRYLGLSSAEDQVEANPIYFPAGSEFRRTDSLSVQAAYFAGRGFTFFSDTTLSREQFAASALFPHAAPFSWLAGAKWQTKRLTVTANYGSLSRSALPVLGYYFGDREGPFAEIRYKVFGTLELFGSALGSRNNLEHDPGLVNLSTEDATAGANVILPGQIALSGQYSKLSLRGELLSDPAQNQSQHSTQSQAALSKTVSRHNLTFTARDLALLNLNYLQKQKSAEIQDHVNVSRFIFGGAVRMQQESAAGRLQNSVFVRASGQVRIRRVSLYGQFETGNDLINKTLFATNSVNTTVAGVDFPVANGWTMQAEAFRTTLLSALNPVNILVLQTQGEGVSDILNNFNQWSFFLRLTHRTHWGAPLPEASDLLNNQPIYGAIEGFVYDDGSQGVAGVSVQLDHSRYAVTDDTGRYRFDEVPEGAHAVVLNMAELPADYSPGHAAPASVTVKTRGVARADLRVVKAGSSIAGVVRGLAAEDLGVVRLENIVINLSPAGNYTTCDGDGEFAFYNLTPGRYLVSIDATSLPENYVLVSEPEVTVDLSAAAGAPAITFQIKKKIEELPVRKVFEASIR